MHRLMTFIAFETFVLVAAMTLVSLYIGMDELVIAQRCTRVEFFATNFAHIFVLINMPPLVDSQRVFALEFTLADFTLKVPLFRVLVEMPVEIRSSYEGFRAKIA